MFGGGERKFFDPEELGKLTDIAKRDEKTVIAETPYVPRLDPSAKIHILAPKFYSRHEALESDKLDPEIFNQLKLLRELESKEKYDNPVTENQRYGWYTDPTLEADRSDARLYFGRQITELVRVKILIDGADKSMSKK